MEEAQAQEVYAALKKIVDAKREAKRSQHVTTDALFAYAIDEAEQLVDRIEGQKEEED